MSTNLENSAVATALKRTVCIPSLKKGNASKNAQTTVRFVLISHASKVTLKNLSSQASTIHEPRTSGCTSWVSKRQRNQRSNCQHPLDYRKSKRITSTSASLTTLKPLCGYNKLWKTLKRWKY